MKDPKETLAQMDRALVSTSMPDADNKVKKSRRPNIDRKRPYSPKVGGWRGHPNSLRALELNRAKTQLGHGTALPKCSKCGRAAVRGLNVCWYHGGAAAAVARRKKDGCANYHRPRVAGRLVDGLIGSGALPRELILNSVFRAVTSERESLRRSGNGRRVQRSYDEQMYLNALRLLQFELVQAWLVLLDQEDGGPWAKAVMKAKNLGVVA